MVGVVFNNLCTWSTGETTDLLLLFFSTSCVVNLLGQPSCHCRLGHFQPLCDSCSGGYFGSPPNTRCTDCSCNDNIDRNIPGSCDPSTGVCLNCINNATGSECELCQSGYFGDATVQECQLCDCDSRGSVNTSCDRNSGQCLCLEGVGGLRCNQCQVTNIYVACVYWWCIRRTQFGFNFNKVTSFSYRKDTGISVRVLVVSNVSAVKLVIILYVTR